MATKKEIQEGVELIKAAKKSSKLNKYDVHVWDGIAALIEKSDFGTKDTEVEINVPVPEKINPLEEMMDGSFDGVIMTVMQFANGFLGDHGAVSVEPYSRGLTTRSMKVKFQTKRG